jgi:hypothetical protein
MGGWNGWSHYYDFENEHASVNWNQLGTINKEVPPQFHDARVYGLPSGLSQVMK